MKHRPARRSFRPRSRLAPVVAAAAVGVAAGLSLVALLVAARVSLVAAGGEGMSDWIALATPLLAALSGGGLAALLLHVARVADRDTLIGVAIAAAAPAFALGHLARLFDPAAALAAGGDRLSLLFWLHGSEWLAGARAAEVVNAAPGLRPAAAVVGIEGCAALAMCELALLGGLLLAAVDRALAAPLCVSCQRWCRRRTGQLRRSAALPPGLVAARAAARDWQFFRELGPPRGRAALRFDLAACSGCDRMSALTVVLVRPLRPDLVLVRDLRLGPDDLRTVRDLAATAEALRARARADRGPVPALLPRS